MCVCVCVCIGVCVCVWLMWSLVILNQLLIKFLFTTNHAKMKAAVNNGKGSTDASISVSMTGLDITARAGTAIFSARTPKHVKVPRHTTKTQIRI